jgi:hypothetical protein
LHLLQKAKTQTKNKLSEMRRSTLLVKKTATRKPAVVSALRLANPVKEAVRTSSSKESPLSHSGRKTMTYSIKVNAAPSAGKAGRTDLQTKTM